MKRRVLLQASLGLGLFGKAYGLADRQNARVSTDSVAPLVWRNRPLLGFGATLSLLVGHPDAAFAEKALDGAVAKIRHIEAQMSLFDPGSALRQLNRQGFLNKPDADLLSILKTAQHISHKSSGTFDVTVQPLWEAFAVAQKNNTLPTQQAVQVARQKIGWQYLEVSAQTIRLNKPDMAVTLNGIAQGYAADQVQSLWRGMGIQHALINTGEWAALGKSQSNIGWVLGIADPRSEEKMMQTISMQGKSIATSSDSQTFFSDDFKNHHIFNPATGYSPADIASVTVAAETCTLADALTKVIFVAGLKNALEVAKHWSVDVLVVDKKGGWLASPGFKLAA